MKTAHNVKLLNGSKQEVSYTGVETVTMPGTDGKDKVFTAGAPIDALDISPDFSGGDMPLEAPEGYVVRSATVKKPEGAEQVIAKGQTLAGIAGAYVMPGTAKEITPDFSGGDQTVAAEGDERWNSVTVKKPDTLIPKNIMKGVNIAGIIGTKDAGLDDWNVFVKIATAPAPFDSVWTIATPDELEKSGITLYPMEATNEELKTLMLMTKIRTATMTKETQTTIDFEYAQNWQIACTGATDNAENGVKMYQTGSKQISLIRVAANTGCAWSLVQPMALNLSKNGLCHTGNLLAKTRCPIGTYLFVILQHKYAKVCDVLV